MPRTPKPAFGPRKVGFAWYLGLLFIAALVGGVLWGIVGLLSLVNVWLWLVVYLIVFLPILYVVYRFVWRGRTLT